MSRADLLPRAGVLVAIPDQAGVAGMSKEPEFVRIFFDRWVPVLAFTVIIVCWLMACVLALGAMVAVIKMAFF
jgi:hypothetical protein